MKENKKIVFDPSGEPIVFEEIMTFKIEELGKHFMAYTVGDDLTSDSVKVDLIEIVKYESDKPTIKRIDDNDWQLVQDVFKKLLETE